MDESYFQVILDIIRFNQVENDLDQRIEILLDADKDLREYDSNKYNKNIKKFYTVNQNDEISINNEDLENKYFSINQENCCSEIKILIEYIKKFFDEKCWDKIFKEIKIGVRA